MNICLVHEEYPEETNFGGIATYEKAVAEEYVRQGHIVYVICRGLEKDKRYVENGVIITRLFVKQSNNQIDDYVQYRKRIATELEQLQKNNQIDIIEVPDWGAETVLFEEKRKVPIVVRLHTPLKVWLKFNRNNFGEVKDLMLDWENKMLFSADNLTCCSKALKKMIINNFNIPSRSIKVTPNPANLKDFYRDVSIKKEDSLIFVGSLEERKGVLLLAKALNFVFKKYPKLNIMIIGKDTKRNERNISTIQYMYDLLEDDFKNNVLFLGQLPNNKLNSYLNKAKVGIFPSLFDNFPYVILESMATGLHIVGSSNSGMVEMLNDNSSIYEAGNVRDLAEKIINKYELSNIEEISIKNINRVKRLYSPKIVCQKMIKLYEKTIEQFNKDIIKKEELKQVLQNIDDDIDIKYYSREQGGVANIVFKVITNKCPYIVKKYLYDYDFNLANELYNIYIKNGVNVIKPINKKLIKINGFFYNVYPYKSKELFDKDDIDIDFFKKIICVNRTTNKKANVLKKCMLYYNYLKTITDSLEENIHIEYMRNILNIFEEIKNNSILKEQFINHGDISKDNVIFADNKMFLIDFDEANVTTLLYDFAVVIIKNFTHNNCVDMNKYNKLKNFIQEKYSNYSNDDFKVIIKFYLCKILLEKFYLHHTGKINLYDEHQMKDNFIKYIEILNLFEKNK